MILRGNSRIRRDPNHSLKPVTSGAPSIEVLRSVRSDPTLTSPALIGLASLPWQPRIHPSTHTHCMRQYKYCPRFVEEVFMKRTQYTLLVTTEYGVLSEVNDEKNKWEGEVYEFVWRTRLYCDVGAFMNSRSPRRRLVMDRPRRISDTDKQKSSSITCWIIIKCSRNLSW